MILDESIYLEKGYYHSVYVMLHFNNQGVVYRKEEQANMDPDPDEQETQGARIDNRRQHQQRMIFEDNGGWVENEKLILHDNMWYVYMNKKKALIKGSHSVEI